MLVGRIGILLEGELCARAISALPAEIARTKEGHLSIDGEDFQELIEGKC